MSTKPELLAGAQRPRRRKFQPGALLFEFLDGHRRCRCELRDHGAHGIGAQFFVNREFRYSRRFDSAMGLTLTPRENAVQWAKEERTAMTSSGNE